MTLAVQSGRNWEICNVSNGITDVFKDADYLCEGGNFHECKCSMTSFNIQPFE